MRSLYANVNLCDAAIMGSSKSQKVQCMVQGRPVSARAGSVQAQRDRHYQTLVDRLLRTDLGDEGAVQTLIGAVLAGS